MEGLEIKERKFKTVDSAAFSILFFAHVEWKTWKDSAVKSTFTVKRDAWYAALPLESIHNGDTRLPAVADDILHI